MERSEPALVPEWLKGGGGGVTLQHALHQDDKPRIVTEIDSPRYVPPRRVTSAFSGGPYEKNGFSSGNRGYPHFSSRRNNIYDHHERTDRDIDKERGLGGYSRDAKDRDLDTRWGQTGKIEQEFSRRHVVGNSGSRNSENGDRRNENGPASGFPGIVQKAVFERNFPTLGSQDKPVYSTLANVTALSPRHHWQRPGDHPGNVTSESWTSNLAEPLSNGVMSSPPAVLPALSSNGPKMAEALVQNSPRLRTSPQACTETQRLELALKQSRQLVPMTPPIPNLKPKPKMVTSITKPGSQLPNAASRPPQQSPRLDTKLRYLKAGSTSPRPDPSNVLGNGKTPATAVPPRKQKQLLDRRAVPIPPLITNTGQDAVNSVRPKENGVSEDKRLAQNRSDFFNTLRKKAAGGGNSHGEKQDNNGVPTVITKEEAGGTTLVRHSEDSSGNSSNGNSAIQVAGANGVIEDKQYSRKHNVGGSEEEEAAFLRSLGWKEDADGEDALTEEEITEFQKKHMRSKTSSPLSKVLGLRADCGFSSLSSGITDSGADGKTRLNQA